MGTGDSVGTGGGRRRPEDDVLTPVLRSLRLSGTTYFDAAFQAPWGLDIKAGCTANFHLLLDGVAWVSSPGEPSSRLDPGDLVVFPHGDPHQLLGTRDGPARPAAQVVERPRLSDPLVLGGPGEQTARLICSHFELDPAVSHPLRDSLPARIHLRASHVADPDWITTATRLAAAEAAGGEPGSVLVVDRLAEALFVRIIRSLADGSTPPGFLSAIRDPVVAAVLRRIHRAPGGPWTLGSLAGAAHVSRAVLARRFKAATGMGAIQYLRLWRMIQGRESLARGDTVPAVARTLGYRSEWAFAKAFKRTFGVGPGEVRAGTRRPA